MRSPRSSSVLLTILLVLCIGRLWLMELPSSFWLDETVTAFVVRHGADHWSLKDAAPQAWKSIYYYLPRVFPFSEIGYRLPSILAMGVVLAAVARLAARWIHPAAGWFAVFACFASAGINYEAADARPYALGMCLAALCFVCLSEAGVSLQHLKSASLWGFIVSAALLWRTHLLLWPFYIVFAIYRRRMILAFGIVAILLLPVAYDAIQLLGDAKAHVVTAEPSIKDFAGSLKLGLVLPAGLLALLIFRQRAPGTPELTPITGWWLCQPVGLFAFSWISGNSVFVTRYLSPSLPGAALMATAFLAFFLPARYWKPAAAAMGIAALLVNGQWRTLWPPHHNSDWRAAAAKVNEFDPATPVLCPSPFVEGRAPVWRPDYPLPGFLYAHLDIYPIPQKPLLLPYETSPEAERYAARLASTLSGSPRFLIYGWEPNVHFWMDWFAARPELAGWRPKHLGPFRDVEVVLFEKGV